MANGNQTDLTNVEGSGFGGIPWVVGKLNVVVAAEGFDELIRTLWADYLTRATDLAELAGAGRAGSSAKFSRKVQSTTGNDGAGVGSRGGTFRERFIVWLGSRPEGSISKGRLLIEQLGLTGAVRNVAVRIGGSACRSCGTFVRGESIESRLEQEAANLEPGTILLVHAESDDTRRFRNAPDLPDLYRAQGIERLVVDDRVVRLDEAVPIPPGAQPVLASLSGAADRATVREAAHAVRFFGLERGTVSVLTRERTLARGATLHSESACHRCGGALSSAAELFGVESSERLREALELFRFDGDEAPLARIPIATIIDTLGALASDRIASSLESAVALRNRLESLVSCGLGHLTLASIVRELGGADSIRLQFAEQILLGFSESLVVIGETSLVLEETELLRLARKLAESISYATVVLVVPAWTTIWSRADFVAVGTRSRDDGTIAILSPGDRSYATALAAVEEESAIGPPIPASGLLPGVRTFRPQTRSSREFLASVTGIEALIASRLAGSVEARLKGLGKEAFSSKKSSFRCDACDGAGYVPNPAAEALLPSARPLIACPECAGQRVLGEVLEVRYRGLSLADCYLATASELVPVFSDAPRELDRLKLLESLGLGGIPLGTPVRLTAPSEANRIELFPILVDARERRKESTRSSVSPADAGGLLAGLSGETLRRLTGILTL